ncbi:MAG: creatininase family protein [Leptolinea sp.]|nr:creatininase family protein [Leptolinea sp.]
MRLEDLNWMDVEEYLNHDDRLMVIIGACEQHGYLSLLTDVRIPQSLADGASKQSGVLIAPPLNFGVSPYFLSYPGTLSLRVETLTRIVEDIIRSAAGVGFRRFLILNGHGGNNGAAAHLVHVANTLPDIQISWYSWWESHSVEAVCMKHGLTMEHGGWGEAFSFTRVTDLPIYPKPSVKIKGMPNATESRQLCGDGMLGGPYQVDDNIMADVFQAALDDVLHLLEF